MKIIVTTCAQYAHIMPDFALAFVRAWPDCRWPVTIMAAEPDPESNLFTPYSPRGMPSNWEHLVCKDLGWAANLLGLISLDDEPFLLLFEDYILDAVDAPVLEACARIIEDIQGIGMIRVHPVPGPTLPWISHIGEIDKAQPYAISFQAAMWRPAVLRDLLRPDEDPWRSEINGSARAIGYDRFRFLGTKESALGYRNLMRRGQEQSDVRAWIEANLR